MNPIAREEVQALAEAAAERNERYASLEARASVFSLTPYELIILHLLDVADDPQTCSQLAHELKCTPPEITQLTRGLERRGLIEMAISKGDRRFRLVSLTPDGRHFFKGVVDE